MSGATTRRWPVLLVLVLLVAGGVALQRHEDDRPEPVVATAPAGLLPTATAPGALSSTWYCAGGTATGTDQGAAEQTVQIVNASGEARTGRVTVVPSEGDRVERSIDLPGRQRVDLEVSSVVKAPYASVVVEVDGGEVAVSHSLEGPTGRTTAACSSSPSASWYFPSGTSRPGTQQLLALFNPFPSEAVVGVSFETDDGARQPQDYKAIVVPGGRVSVLDISGTVTLRDEIATTVTVRSGRLIVDQIQTADGEQGTTKALTVTPGAPQASSTWWFADGPASERDRTVFVVQNPSDHSTPVELQVRLDDVATNGEVEPFQINVGAGRYAVVDIAADGRVPVGVGYTAVAQSADGTPIVAARLIGAPPPDGATAATPAFESVALGSPVLAGRWLVPLASAPSASVAVIVTNPSDTDPVSLTLSTVSAGSTTALPGMQDVTLPPGVRSGFSVPVPAGEALVAVEVASATPVAVESRVSFGTSSFAEPLAVPVDGSTVVLTEGLAPPSPSPDFTVPPDASVDPTGDTGDTGDTSDPAATGSSGDSGDSSSTTPTPGSPTDGGGG